MSFHFSPNIVTDGLILYWDSANTKSYSGAGSVWSDMIGSYVGTLNNSPTFATSNSGSFNFDGINDNVSTNYLNGFGTSNLTLNIWMSYTASQQSGIFSKRIGASSFEQLSVFVTGDINANTTGTKILVLDYNNPDSRNIFTSQSYNDGLWHLISYVRDTSSSKLYIDGAFISETVSSKPNLSNTSRLFIGAVGDGLSLLGLYFKGSVSIVSMYNRALSQSEVFQNYQTIKSRFSR